MSRALNVLALAFALAFAGCSSTSERTRAEGFRSPRIFAGGFGAAQGSTGGGNPTGYSESGGVVTLANSLNVGTATDAVATGDFAAGLTGAARMFYDQSAGLLTLYNSTLGVTAILLPDGAGYAALFGGPGDNLRLGANNGAAWEIQSGGALIPILPGSTLGTTSSPVPSLTLGDATAQVKLSGDGATDGLLRISDPHGVALGRVELMAADGTTAVGRMRAAGSNLVLESVSGALSFNHAGSTVCYTEANVLRPNAAGAQSLGTETAYWSVVSAQEHRGAERSSNPTAPAEGRFVLFMSDGTGVGDDGDVILVSTAGGTTTYTIVHDHSAGTSYP